MFWFLALHFFLKHVNSRSLMLKFLGAAKNTSEPVPKMPNNNNGTEILKDHMSREAQNILDGLPLLNFMSRSLFKHETTVKK